MKRLGKKEIFVIAALVGVAYYFYRKNQGLTSSASIGGNKLPLGDLSAAISAQGVVASYVDAGLKRQEQQAEMFKQDKSLYEQMNPGHVYEDDFPVFKGFMQ